MLTGALAVVPVRRVAQLGADQLDHMVDGQSRDIRSDDEPALVWEFLL